MAALSTRYTDSSLYGIILDIHLLSRSDYLVCTFSSQVCRVAFEIMQSLYPDASDRFKSLDDIYYYGGQNAHNREAVISHRPQNHDEIYMNVGDLVGVAGNHWDGYSKGRNVRTNQNGLFPSFKVIDRVETAEFPKYADVKDWTNQNLTQHCIFSTQWRQIEQTLMQICYYYNGQHSTKWHFSPLDLFTQFDIIILFNSNHLICYLSCFQRYSFCFKSLAVQFESHLIIFVLGNFSLSHVTKWRGQKYFFHNFTRGTEPRVFTAFFSGGYFSHCCHNFCCCEWKFLMHLFLKRYVPMTMVQDTRKQHLIEFNKNGRG